MLIGNKSDMVDKKVRRSAPPHHFLPFLRD
jgi:hypothetical protein